jgi:branched-chain amino acid transport system substrate-binding protein
MVKNLDKQLPVELKYYDDKSSTDTAVKVYEKLITQEKVDLLLSPVTTDIHFAVVPVAEKYRAPIVGSTASSIKIRDLDVSFFWFTTASVPDRQMQALVELMKSKKADIQSVGILYVQQLFQVENLKFLRPALKDAGFDVVLAKDYSMGTRDVSTLLNEVKAAQPDAILILSDYADSFLLTGQSIEEGLNPKLYFMLLGAAGIGYEMKFGSNLEGVATIGHWVPGGPWKGAAEFNQKYIAKFGKRPDYLNSVLGYMSAQILQQAVERAGTLEWDKIRQLIATEKFETINGPVSFKGPENAVTPSMVLQWQSGKLEIVWPPEARTAEVLFPKPAWE